MKFCDIKTAERQGKSTKAGLYGPRRVDFPPSIRPFSCHPSRARRKKKPDIFKCLGRSIHYGLRPFHSRITFFVSRRIHAIYVDWSYGVSGAPDALLE